MIGAALVFATTSVQDSQAQPHFHVQRSLVVGAWRHNFHDSIAVFLPDGRVLFTFMTIPEKDVKDWHLIGKWKEIQPGQIEVVFSRKPPPGEPGDHQTDVYEINAGSPNELISPHGGKLIRIAAKGE